MIWVMRCSASTRVSSGCQFPCALQSGSGKCSGAAASLCASAAARWLAKRENDADLIGGVNLDVKDRHLAQTLLDLSQTAAIQDSIKLARAVLNEIGGVNSLHKDDVEQAGCAVLKAPDIPSILVETAFISNPAEEQKLNDDAYQDKMAHALFRGIKRYFARNPPLSRPTLATLQ